jgi:hypothetical protein
VQTYSPNSSPEVSSLIEPKWSWWLIM